MRRKRNARETRYRPEGNARETRRKTEGESTGLASGTLEKHGGIPKTPSPILARISEQKVGHGLQNIEMSNKPLKVFALKAPQN